MGSAGLRPLREASTRRGLLLLLLLSRFSHVQLCVTPEMAAHQAPPGSTIPGILQARALEWVAIALLLSHFSRVQLCATPETAAHPAPPSLGFSRKEHWSGLPFPSPMHESEKQKGSHSVMSDSSQPHRLQPTRLLHPWDFPGKSTGVGCHCLLWQPLLELTPKKISFLS